MLRELWENNFIRVGLGLVIGLGFIIYMNPPYTPCDSQKEIFDKELNSYVEPYNKNLGLCKQLTGPGGCVGYFQMVEKIEKSIKDLGAQCRPKLATDEKAQKFLSNALEVYTRVAWGTKAPASYLQRNGWLELSQNVQFCRIKKLYADVYGAEALSEIVNRLLGDLPQAAQVGRTEVWNRSLLSDPCRYSGL